MSKTENKVPKKLYPYKVRHIINASYEHVPDIAEGQILGLEPLNGKQLENGEYYYIRYQGKELIRKIYITDTGLMLVRVNPKYSSEFYEFTDDREKQLVVLSKLNLHPDFSKKETRK